MGVYHTRGDHAVLTNVLFNQHHSHYEYYIGEAPPHHHSTTVTVATPRVYLYPIIIPHTVTIINICNIYGATVAGNKIKGLYTSDGVQPAGGTLLAQTPSSAKAGINQLEETLLALLQLQPGLYFGAYESDENTTIMRCALVASITGATLQSYSFDLGGYGALPAVCPAVVARSGPVAFLRVASIP